MNNSSVSQHYPFENRPLPYAYDALEPFIDSKTMELHHDRHLQTYIDNLNDILSTQPALQKLSLVQLIYVSSGLPQKIKNDLINNAGGVFNHFRYFEDMSPKSTKKPEGDLADTLDEYFGSFDNFKEEFKAAALSVFGSGYAWLIIDENQPVIITTPNQNNPIQDGYCPVMNIDVWEHAYYLKHYNERAKYIDDWFNVVDWEKIGENYSLCKLYK